MEFVIAGALLSVLWWYPGRPRCRMLWYRLRRRHAPPESERDEARTREHDD